MIKQTYIVIDYLASLIQTSCWNVSINDTNDTFYGFDFITKLLSIIFNNKINKYNFVVFTKLSKYQRQIIYNTLNNFGIHFNKIRNAIYNTIAFSINLNSIWTIPNFSNNIPFIFIDYKSQLTLFYNSLKPFNYSSFNKNYIQVSMQQYIQYRKLFNNASIQYSIKYNTFSIPKNIQLI